MNKISRYQGYRKGKNKQPYSLFTDVSYELTLFADNCIFVRMGGLRYLSNGYSGFYDFFLKMCMITQKG